MILKLKPFFSTKIWGGNKIKENYGYDCAPNTGEAWGISAHKSGPSIIENTEFKGMSLRNLYQTHRELFGNYPADEFPILVKVIDATDDLSIQVHPDDAYAKKYENSYGKTECWLILDTDPNTDIIIGHKAQTIEEFKTYVKNSDFESVVNKFPIKKGDIFNIYAGTLHAICKGTLLLEIQQSSDVTYRVYDYNRLSNGELRPLHLKQAYDVIKCPDIELNKQMPEDFFIFNTYKNSRILNGKADEYGDYLFILSGEGKIDDIDVKAGDFLIATSHSSYTFTGNFTYFKANIK